MNVFDHDNIDEVREHLSDVMADMRERLSEEGDNGKREQAMVMLLHILKKAEDSGDMTTAYAACNAMVVAITSMCLQIGYDPYNSEDPEVVEKTNKLMTGFQEIGIPLV